MAQAVDANDPNYEIVPILEGYLQEAEMNRRGGYNNRDDKWEENLRLYWNRQDFSQKAEWQSKVALPEVSTHVDRFAAAMKDAVVANPDSFYTVHDPADTEGDVTEAIKRATDAWLSVCGTNMLGTPLSFPAVFEEQVKMGAMMNACTVVNWKRDVKYGRVAVETVDPRMVWLDPTGRNLYRVRRSYIDKSELIEMANMRDGKGKSIYNIEAIRGLGAEIQVQDQERQAQASGHGQEITSTRQPITLDEYIATVVHSDGRVLARNALMVVANRRWLIRGPEENPFWHGQDWLSYASMVTAPLSVYGRSYMEDFGTIADTFNSVTNLIIDSVQMSAMKAFVMVPGMLLDAAQASEPITPNKVYTLQEGYTPSDFLADIDLGNMKPEVMQLWQAMKNELREAADINEVGLGQFAPKGRTSATEIDQTQQSSSALVRSVAHTVETRILNPTLDRVWKTGFQHVMPNDPAIMGAIGKDLHGVLMKRRREIVRRPITFQARGISMLIQKSKMLKSLLMLMQILAQSDLMLAEFLKEADLAKLVKFLFQLSDIDMNNFALSQREKMIRDTVEQMQAGIAAAGGGAAPGGAAPPGVGQEMKAVTQKMGISK